MTPPYRVRTPRLTLRRLEPRDAEILGRVTAANEEHLAPWMPWAHDLPRPLDRTIAHLERLSAEFERGHDFNFGVWESSESALVGGLGLHPRVGLGAMEIGYWIVSDRTSRGYATEATAAATRIAFEELGAERVEIHVEPQNLRSQKVPARLGFRRKELSRHRLQWRNGTWRDQVIWTLRAEELPGTPAASMPYELVAPEHPAEVLS